MIRIEQARALNAYGVRFLQGWLVGRPQDPMLNDPMQVNEILLTI